ncbi:dipeptidyl carboxypeptidase II [Novosphingobium sp. PC22D]|nr:dipeptidyl carboxypeptidase II [Novosphingobium sp. PC22D]
MDQTAFAKSPAASTALPEASGIFAEPSALPYHAPDFSRIRDEDFAPAFEQAIAIKRAEIAAISANREAPTFANTIVAIEKAGRMLSRVNAVFSQLTSANTNDTLDAVDKATAPKLSALTDDIYLDDRLFARVKSVYDRRAAMTMTPEDAMLLETTYDDFVHRGALLSAEKKAQLKTMNGRIAELQTTFSQMLTAASNAAAPVFDSAEELDGLSPGAIAAAKKRAEERGLSGKYVLAITNTTQQPEFASLTNRETRRKLFEASVNRASNGGENDTLAIVTELAQLRARKADLLGLPDYATYAMYDRMVKDPAAAARFLDDFVPALRATQDREARVLEDFAHSQGDAIKIEPWDWGYYAEQVRKARYDLDEEQIKPYFGVYDTLENGVFYAATQFYGITFKRREDIPVYHPTIRVYEVFDADGTPLALFYFDPFARPNKRGGAWKTNFVPQSELFDERPVIVNTLNIPPPAEGEPPLATWDNVETMFHEFGHALHTLFAHQRYPSLSGSATARDFVEFPSQFNENFATVPAVLSHYAKHHETGETIPSELVEKIERASKFNQGLGFGETLEAAMLDMKWHRLTPEQAKADPMAFERQALATTGLATDVIPPRYKTPYFRHVWGGGYAAGYYSYIWTEMLAHDAWSWVVENGGPSRANGEHIRKTFLGEGHTKDYAMMYRDFAGRDPRIGPMLEAKGLTGDDRKPTAGGDETP